MGRPSRNVRKGKLKVAIILGTRPEIIKLSPVIRECKKRKINFFILHTNQHYSSNLDSIFFDELELVRPKYNLRVGSGTHAEEIGKMLIGIESVLKKENPTIVLVQGDTNTVLAGAIVANKLRIKVGHVEAGLRSFFKEMPEENNRILTDHCSDYLFVPTKKARENLFKEGIDKKDIYLTGNTVVDAVIQNLKFSKNKSRILKKFKISNKKYLLVTVHRAENVDDKEKLQNIFKGLESLYLKLNLPVIFPIHPRTRKMMKNFNIPIPRGVVVNEPVGFFDFLQLESNAKVVLTDSGGVQEETCIMKVPCVCLRENTERPETLSVKSNVLVGSDPQKILDGVLLQIGKSINWANPFGDGMAAKRIVDEVNLIKL